jgi:hypothetical protein
MAYIPKLDSNGIPCQIQIDFHGFLSDIDINNNNNTYLGDYDKDLNGK